MARKQDTRTRPPKPAGKKTSRKGRDSIAAAKPRAKAVRKAPPPSRPSSVAQAVDAVRTPIAAVESGSKKALKGAKARILAATDRTTAPKRKGGKGKAGRASSVLGILPEMPAAPSSAVSDVTHQVGEAFKTIGTQIAGALNTDVGRVMMAELLIYVAKSLTKAASETQAAESAKAAMLQAGARIGAAAADAGARMVDSGRTAAETGSKAMEAGIEGAGGAAGQAGGLLREVAQVAVGAVGGAVMDAAQRAMSRRREGEGEAAMSETAAGADEGERAPAIAADAGHRPPAI